MLFEVGQGARARRPVPAGNGHDRRRINRSPTPTDRLLPAALLLKAAAVAAREVPALNGSWQNGAFAPASEINLGVAVSLRQGGSTKRTTRIRPRCPARPVSWSKGQGGGHDRPVAHRGRTPGTPGGTPSAFSSAAARP
ncbi:2-oxo acid dehydrogenase subunit E2 [Streptomyces collinus]|uniref:2-oxo acid dehydrogenase subunit E2 n=1 Tax=Streptomyces collinus TaxID=42684 RepID=UPI0036E9EFD1